MTPRSSNRCGRRWRVPRPSEHPLCARSGGQRLAHFELYTCPSENESAMIVSGISAAVIHDSSVLGRCLSRQWRCCRGRRRPIYARHPCQVAQSVRGTPPLSRVRRHHAGGYRWGIVIVRTATARRPILSGNFSILGAPYVAGIPCVFTGRSRIVNAGGCPFGACSIALHRGCRRPKMRRRT